MKRLTAYIFSWTLYWIGHWVSLVMGTIPSLYSAYRWAMLYSIRLQDWAGNKTPWKHVNNKQ